MPRAILIAVGGGDPSAPGGDALPFLLPLVDRPFLQHVVERLAAQGIGACDVVLSEEPETVQRLLGDGTRWGVTFHYHLTPDPARPYGPVRALRFDDRNEPILLASADCLPAAGAAGGKAVCLRAPDDGGLTGWGWLPAHLLNAAPPDATVTEFWQAAPVASQTLAAVVLRARSAVDLLAAQRVALSGGFPDLLQTGREIEPGIHLSRNVMLHPTARVQGPVFIGENCSIAAGAEIGPNAVIGANCVVDVGASITESVILAGSYVGEGLEIEAAIVDRNRLTSVRHGATLTVTESFLLGDLERSGFADNLGALTARLAAAVLVLLLSPVLLLTVLFLGVSRKGPPALSREILALPASADEGNWRTVTLFLFADRDTRRLDGMGHLFLRVLPGLISVAAGHLRLAGVEPRAPEGVRALPPDWRALYLRSRPGLITEAFVNFGPSATSDEIYSAEAYYTVTRSVWHDAALLCRYVARLLSASPERWGESDSTANGAD